MPNGRSWHIASLRGDAAIPSFGAKRTFEVHVRALRVGALRRAASDDNDPPHIGAEPAKREGAAHAMLEDTFREYPHAMRVGVAACRAHP
jgi:hypothetical protein